MTTDAPLSPPVSATGLDEDLKCPECRYNLHGLTVPRCPECGYTFTWDDLPRIRELGSSKGDYRGAIVAVLLPVVLFEFMLLAAIPPLGILVLIISCMFLLGAVQAGIEIMGAAWVLGVLSLRRFRAWWEGVLLGYALCGLTCLLAGLLLIFFETRSLRNTNLLVWELLCITAVESLLVQWWLVRWRMRYWKDPITGRCLLAACALGKVPTIGLWAWLISSHLIWGCTSVWSILLMPRYC